MKFNKQYLLPFAGFCVFSLTACQNPGGETGDEADNQASDTAVAIQIQPANSSPEFPDAALEIKDVKSEVSEDSVKVTFQYEVSNYELKQQTSDAAGKGCSNSKDGQHIHFILDNGPYTALYKPEHTFTVAKNSEHDVLSFLSRSYHESVKSKDAYVLYTFKVDENGKVNQVENPNSPMVFFSRPKGDYLGKDTDKVLLDFYVLNTTLGTDSKVKATLNGTEFTIDQWKPYFIEHAPMGDLEVSLQLVDMNDQPLSGKNTQVSRTARLAKSEPME